VRRLITFTIVSVLALAGNAAANGPIIYQQIDFSNNEASTLWSAQVGDVTSRITQCPSCYQEAPEVSGSRVFFDSDLVPPIHVFSSNLDGSDVQQITFSASGFEGFPTVSPDGVYVAYDNQDDEFGANQGIYVARVDGTGTPQRLTFPTKGFIDTSPEWSPDGDSIAFVKLRLSGCGWHCRSHGYASGFKGAVYLMDSDGSNIRRLTPDNGHSWADPSWAPDSQSLLVQSYNERATIGASSNEFTIGADGRGLTRLTGGQHEFWFSGDYSADGTRIALMHYVYPNDYGDLVDMAADGSDAHVVATCSGAIACDDPSW
jgi:Tol biopolymer transport system component